MEKVFNLTARLEDKKRKEQIEAFRDRFDAVQRVLQCTGCQYKCAMCNRHIDPQQMPEARPSSMSEFVLCDSCQTEFEAYQDLCQRGRTEPEVFWHTREWIHFWTCWLDYQHSIRNFRDSFDINRIPQQSEE